MSTKIHATCDALGNPTALFLTPGQAHDLGGADALVLALKAAQLLADNADNADKADKADNAYNADERVLERPSEQEIEAVIPPKANRLTSRSYDAERYNDRHLTETLFSKLKRFRALAARYDQTARNFPAAIYVAIYAAIHLAAVATWLACFTTRSKPAREAFRFLTSLCGCIRFGLVSEHPRISVYSGFGRN